MSDFCWIPNDNRTDCIHGLGLHCHYRDKKRCVEECCEMMNFTFLPSFLVKMKHERLCTEKDCFRVCDMIRDKSKKSFCIQYCHEKKWNHETRPEYSFFCQKHEKKNQCQEKCFSSILYDVESLFWNRKCKIPNCS